MRRAAFSLPSPVSAGWVVAVAALAGALAAQPAGSAASTAGPRQGVDLDAFPRVDVGGLADRYRDWLAEVEVILTTAERDVFLRCETDAQRDAFIEKFWQQRDPTPGTPRNEYQELFYERVAYADDQFGRATARRGSQTDRGRIHILLGEPMNVTRLANSQFAYPVEVWFYHADPRLGIPPFFYVAFFRELGLGEYQLYSPAADGPMSLLNPAGVAQVRELQSYGRDGVSPGTFTELAAAYDVLRYVDGDLAHAAFSLIPGEGSMAQGRISLASDMMLAQIQEIPNRIMPTAQWAYSILTGSVEAEVRFETLPLAGTATALLDPSGIPFVHFAVETEGGRLNMTHYEDEYYFTFEIAAALTDERRRVLSDLRTTEGGARIMQGTLDPEEAGRLRAGSFIYMDQMPAIDGDYRFEIVLENNVSREFGRATFDLSVPAPRDRGVGSSRPILLRDYDRLPAYDAFGQRLPFQIGPLGMVPAIDATFTSGRVLHVFHQIYASDEARRAGDGLRATYRLENEAGFLTAKVESIDPARADLHGTINQVVTLSLETVPPGEYRLLVDVDGDDRDPAYLPVRVVGASQRQAPPFVQSRQQLPATDPQIAYDRALQYRTTGRIEEAIDLLGSALRRVPDFEEGVELQVELLIEGQRYEEVDRLLAPRLVERPNDVDLLVKLAEVNANLGRHYDAIRYYERGRLSSGEDRPELLNPLAAVYHADGQSEKARQLLERSLELDPDQPEIERLLREVLNRRPRS